MTLQDMGALGEMVGGVGVIASLIYVAYQIRQNSRHIEASMYHATNDAFYRWYSHFALDAEVGTIWLKGLRGERLTGEERIRFESMIAMLFLAYENNFEQINLGSIRRDTFGISRQNILGMMSLPAVQDWWNGQGARILTPDFRRAIETIVERERACSGAQTAEEGGQH